ncbi:galanin receptor type 2-like [Cololabis saira]|uniref:galanin receptor type 2-like n=1 Tax=Cololabis saira TaxID=129043 RepID=UPI002AD1E4F1|nr:galanin receptor type 2-like [Cololabis saira]
METLRPQMNNNSAEPLNNEDKALIKALVPLLDGLILVTGLVGQTLIIMILTGRRKKGNQPPHGTDTLLLALSTADLLLLLCLPFNTSAITLGFWPFGSFMCKAVSFLCVACSAASVFTLAALAVTRYLTVVHPTWAYRARMDRRIKVTVALLWAPASALAAPQFAFRTTTFADTVYCFAFLSDVSQMVYSIALFLFGFALPLAVIVLMYTKIYLFLRHARQVGNALQLERYQRQVTHTSALLVAVFTLLWLPSYALMFSIIGGTLTASPGYNTIALLARLLSSSVAVVNPVLYGFISQKFRRDLLRLGRGCWTWCRSNRIGCPCAVSRDTVQPFQLETTSERAQN